MRAAILFLLFIVSVNLYAKETYLFYQPWNSDFNGTLFDDKTFRLLKQHGITAIVVQWTRYGDNNFIRKFDKRFKKLFLLGERYRIKIITGLYADPNYFKYISEKKLDTEHYLTTLLHHNQNTAKELDAQFKHYRSWGGWYIYDEINDVVWSEERRYRLIQSYLRQLSHTIKSINDKPIYISAYYTGTVSLFRYIDFINTVIPKGTILFLQSGVGAGLLDLQEAKHYFTLFGEFCNKHLVYLSEMFHIKKDKKIVADATLYRMQSDKLGTNCDRALFSWRYFMKIYRQ